MKIANGESCFYQWEWDQQLELPFPCAAVYFENGTQSEAPGCKVKEVGGKWLCDVPNDLLQTAANLHAFAWDEEKTHVVGYAVFTVIPRAKPANYVYTQTEVWTAEKAVAEALEKAKASGEFKGEKGEKGDPQDAVCYDTDQSLSDEQKAQARDNIGAANADYFIVTEGGSASANIYNWQDPEVESDTLVNMVNGETFSVAYMQTSGYIPIESGKTYTFPVIANQYGWNGETEGQVAVYDAGKNFIYAATGTLDGKWLLTVTISDESAAFIRTSMSLVASESSMGYSYDTMMVVEGTEYPSEYIAYALAEPSVSLNPIVEINVKIPDILAEEVTPASANLFNANDPDVVENYFVNVYGGALVASNYCKTTGYIPIENGKTYTFPVASTIYGWSTTGYVALYDADKNSVGKASGTITEDLLTVTIDNANATYLRTTIGVSSSNKYYDDNMMIVEGTEYPSAYIPFQAESKKTVLGIDLATDYVQNLLNPLYKKTIIWNGDSICAGKAFDDEGDAWAGRIANRNGMNYKNYAVGGGTIAENVTFNGTTMHSISGTLDTMYAEYPNADYIIIEGGTNDADIIGSHLGENNPEKFGTFNESQFTGTFDRNTFCGALESIFYRATNYWKGKKIGFIVAHKMGSSGTGYGAEVSNRRNYFETAMKIAEKWGIPVLNLWDGCYLNPSLTTMWKYDGTWEENKEAGKFYADGQHLLSAGYDYTADIINNWLKTL